MTKTGNVDLRRRPREDVEIHLEDGRILEGPRGLAVGMYLRKLPEWGNPPVVGAVVNDELRELSYPIEMDARVRLVTMADADGARIYRRSLIFLLECAFDQLFGPAQITVDHSVSSGGYYCQVNGRAALSPQELSSLQARMHELVERDLPLEREEVQLQEAVEYFTACGLPEKVRLLKYRVKDKLVLYTLDGIRDYHHGYMVPSTGFLRWFNIFPLDEQGFILQFPRRHSPRQLSPMPEYPKLLASFRQYSHWLENLGIGHVGAMNDAAVSGNIREIILVSEALHEQQIDAIARQILTRVDEAPFVFIAGPSSSGKTTSSKRLAVQLLAMGVSPLPIEMDNYFVDREKTPLDENGKYDFESIDAVDRARLQDDLRKLARGEEVQLPRYDFQSGKSMPGEVIRLHKDQILILEGIHGLNPALLPDTPADRMFRIYVSCLTQLNLDRHNRISTTDSRLLRRLVRDSRDRGYSAQVTINRWESVRRGEKRYIFPYQENADVLLNTALVYELAALRTFAEPLLRQVPFGTPEYVEAKRLLAFLQWFVPVDVTLIPDNSILREFIGGSILRDFRIWDRFS